MNNKVSLFGRQDLYLRSRIFLFLYHHYYLERLRNNHEYYYTQIHPYLLFIPIGKGAMAQGEDPEWLLWCMRLKLEHTKIFNQLATLTEADLRIEILAAKVADSIAGNDQIQAENTILKDRIASLEQDAKCHYQTNPPDSQVIDKLQAETEALEDRVLRLEQEANQQDQINALSSQSKATLEQKFEILKMEYISVTDAVGTMQKTARVERQGQRRELKEMKANMEVFMAGISQRNNDPTREDPNPLTGLFPASKSPVPPSLKYTDFNDNRRSITTT